MLLTRRYQEMTVYLLYRWHEIRTGLTHEIVEMSLLYLGSHFDFIFFKNPNTFISDTSESDDGALSYRAKGYTLVAFLDGHAEAFKKGTVKYKNITISP